MTDMEADNGESFDGFYGRSGNPVRLVIQTPSDMLPPIRQSAELPSNGWRVGRNTFRSRF